MFKKFQSIRPVSAKALQKVMDQYGDRKAHVLEKVHGANYHVTYDGKAFTIGSRKQQLDSDTELYGDKLIRDTICKRVRNMYNLIKEQVIQQEAHAVQMRDQLHALGQHAMAEEVYESTKPSVSPYFTTLRVRGELYGGMYNHPDVAKLHNVARVGKGKISYSQNISMAAFAVEIDGVPLPWIQAKVLCFSVDIPTVPCVFNGTFEECVAWSAENKHAPTLIPNGTPWLDEKGEPLLDEDGALQALPRIEGNIREGHIIVFQDPIFVDDDGTHIMFKDVNDEFAELDTKRKGLQVSDQMSPSEQTLLSLVGAGFTEERMVTQFSYDEYKRSEFRKVMGKVVQDTLGEIRAANSLVADIYENLDKKRRKKVNAELYRMACRLMRSKFMELCDE